MTSGRLESRFAGAMLGTFAGDALGMPVEGWSPERIADAFGTLDDLRSAAPGLRAYSVLYGLLTDPTHPFSPVRMGRGSYTDDTQMMVACAESLASCGRFDGEDMARRFVENFDPRRGYGRGTTKTIRALRRGLAWDEVGTQVFKGGGSYGNGAAMRIAPIAVFYHEDLEELRRVAELSAIISHTHPLAKEGAVLQAFAIACAMRREAGHEVEDFLGELQSLAQPVSDVFREKLSIVGSLLARQPTVREVVDQLGNDVTIQGSVPAALYSFLSHANSFRQAVVFAVSLGGDTDTIAAMTGAIAGAFHGVKAIPREWLAALENGRKGRDYVKELSARLGALKYGA